MESNELSERALGSLITQHQGSFEQIRTAAKEHAELWSKIAQPDVIIGSHIKSDHKKKAAVKKDKSKVRSSKGKMVSTQASEFPGAIPGVENHASLLWLGAESYFRDITADDILRLCPAYDDPNEDPLFHVPYSGAPFESEEDIQARAREQENQALKPRARRPVQNALETPGSPIDLFAQADDKQRKSSRLGAKAGSRNSEAGMSPPRSMTSPSQVLRSTQMAQNYGEEALNTESKISKPSVRDRLSEEQIAFLEDWGRRFQPDLAGNSEAMDLASNPTGTSAPANNSKDIDLIRERLKGGLKKRDPQKHLARVALYTKEMLDQPPTNYVESSLNTSKQQDTQIGLHPQNLALDSPQTSEQSKAPHLNVTDDSSSVPRVHSQLEMFSPSTPQISINAQLSAGLGEQNRGSNLLETLKANNPNLPSNQQNKSARPGKSRFAGIQNAKSKLNGPTNSQHKQSKPKTVHRLGTNLDPSKNTISAAVSTYISQGRKEGDLEEEWGVLEQSADIASMAPDDEILAEIYALQSELLQQMAINRGRIAPLLENVMKDLPQQRKEAQSRAEGTQIAKDWILKQKAAKRIVKRERREAAQREALKASEANLTISPRKAREVRPRGFSMEPSTSSLPRNPTPPPQPLPNPLPEVVMYDLLAERSAEDEALCAVCGGGDSDKNTGNEIVFCERCDVAVHQKCYAVDVIPAGEWLCWPCKKYEDGQLADGKSRDEIRPHRFDLKNTKAGQTKELTGGARTVECVLCPVRRGAFRQTIDSKLWIHQVCALWHPEPRVLPGNMSEAIEGLKEISSERWGVQCSVCRRSEGAIVRCNSGHCATAFHPLCARNTGLHLTTRDSSHTKHTHRVYCAQHSEAQRLKDLGSDAESSAAFLRNQSRIKQHLEKVNAGAIKAHGVRLEQRQTIHRVRLELESLRILLQRVNKREKLKRDLLRTTFEEGRESGTLPNPKREQEIASGTSAPQNHAEVNGRGVKRKASLEPMELKAENEARESPGEINLPNGNQVVVKHMRQVDMTPTEAAVSNQKFGPKGFIYVPKNDSRIGIDHKSEQTNANIPIQPESSEQAFVAGQNQANGHPSGKSK